MKRFNSIQDFAAIKCEAKACSDALRKLHYQANEIIYSHAQQYAFPRNVQAAIDELTKTFVKIKDLEVPATAKAKKEEILQKGRKMVRSLKAYKQNFTYDKSCVDGIEAMCRFQLHKCLIAKDNWSIEEGAELLRGNKVLKAIAEDVEHQLKAKPHIDAFLQIQGNIIAALGKQLQGYAFAS